jgi:hypothetical protein
LRKGEPTAKYIVDLLTRKEEEFSVHISDYDVEAVEQYLQTNPKSAHNPTGKDTQGKPEIKSVGTGMIGFMQDQDVSIIHTKPFARAIAFGGKDAERHASQVIEPWVNTAVWLGAQGDPIWDKGCLNLENVGRFWSKVLPAPQLWQSEELEELVKAWNDAEDAEARKEAKEKVDEYKSNPSNFPIVWRRCAPSSTWPEYDERPGVAEVVEKRKMPRASVEAILGEIEGKEKEIEVIEYANDEYVATVIKGNKKWHRMGRNDDFFLYEPWEHGLGVNPYVLVNGLPVPDNEDGRAWRSATLHQQKLVPVFDEVLTDMRTNFHRSTVTPYFVKANLEGRADQGIEEKQIKVEEGKTVQMYAGKGWEETAGLFPTPEVNPTMFHLLNWGTQFMEIGMMGREAQAGQTLSGQSAVSQEQARQVANGRLAIPHRNLQDGFAQIAERFLRAVVSLNKRFPESMDKVTIRERVAGNKGREISVGPDDVKDFFHSIEGEIRLNIAINENANVTNAKMATDPQKPLLSDSSALQRYFDHEDPEGEGDKIAEEQLVRGGVQILLQSLQQRLLGGVEQMAGPDLQALIQRAQGLPQASQQAIQQSLGQNAGMMEQISRSAALGNRAGRGQAPSNLTGMPSGT